jgi:hypothetical protein
LASNLASALAFALAAAAVLLVLVRDTARLARRANGQRSGCGRARARISAFEGTYRVGIMAAAGCYCRRFADDGGGDDGGGCRMRACAMF